MFPHNQISCAPHLIQVIIVSCTQYSIPSRISGNKENQTNQAAAKHKNTLTPFHKGKHF